MRPPATTLPTLPRLAALAALVAVAGCGDNTFADPQTVADHVRLDDRFGSLETALREADLLETLDGPGPFTLFAPTDDAFDALFSERAITSSELLAMPQLADLLRHHIHEGELTTAELERITAVATIDGPEIHIRFGLDGILLNDGAKIVSEPIVATNGIIHVLDRVLVRPLVATTRRYESSPGVAISQRDEEGFGETLDFLIVEETDFIHDLRIFINIEHTDVSDLYVDLEHVQTGTFVQLINFPRTSLDDIDVTFADSAASDILSDFATGDDVGQAFPEAAYRPRDPLEFLLGEPLDGIWRLRIFDGRLGETGRLVSWGFLATAGPELPAPAIVFNRRTLSAPVLSRGFTEAATARVRRVGGLADAVEINGSAGDLVAETRTLAPDEGLGSLLFTVPQDAELGPRELAVSGKSGDVSRIMLLDTRVVQPESSGVDLLAHVPLPALGAEGFSGNDIWGWTDPVTGAEIALVGTATGTAFVDVSTPETPLILGTLPTETSSSDWRDIKVYQDHAFIVSEARDHGMQVFDLTQLRGATAPQSYSATAHNDEFGSAHNIAINETSGFAYVVGSDFSEACSGGLLMYDISTPALPVSLGCFAGGTPVGQVPGPQFPGDVYTHDVQCVTYAGPDAAHVGGEVCLSSDQDSIGIADVTDKISPAQLARVSYPGVGYTHQGWLTEDHRYFILNDEFDEFISDLNTRSYVFDVSDLEAPVLIGVIENPRDAVGHNTYIKGNVAYQANYTSGLRLVDIGSIAGGVGTEVAFYDTYPDDDDGDDGNPGGSRCNTSAGARLVLPHTDVDTEKGCRVASFRGAWSSYPFFASGVIVVSDIDRGLFVLRPR